MKLIVNGAEVSLPLADECPEEELLSVLKKLSGGSYITEQGVKIFFLTYDNYIRAVTYAKNYNAVKEYMQSESFAQLSPRERQAFEEVNRLEPEMRVCCQLCWAEGEFVKISKTDEEVRMND